MDSDDETILSKMDEHRIGEIDSLDQSGVSTDVPLLDTPYLDLILVQKH